MIYRAIFGRKNKILKAIVMMKESSNLGGL